MASSIVSDALISEDSQQRTWGTHALVRQLAAVAQMEKAEGCLPGTLLGSAAEGIDSWLYANVDGAPESHAASWMAAAFKDSAEVAQGLRELLSTITRLLQRTKHLYHTALTNSCCPVSMSVCTPTPLPLVF